MKWDRVEPVEPCDSPDGHEMADVVTARSTVPERVVCTRCGRNGQVVIAVKARQVTYKGQSYATVAQD